MASGGDNPQLPRGLIGRTGTPSGKGTRLPSIKGPRDLTLGGVQKKVFVPNIPARRNKPSESIASDSASASTPKSNDGKRPNSGGSGRGRDSGDRGRGRGRGRGRMSANVIQTHSLFEQGPTEKINKPTGGGDYAYSGGGRGGSSSSSPKKSVKRERTDEETKEVLDNLLRDDFIAGGGFDEDDITLMPVKLPIEIKTDPSIKKDDYTKVKVKSEPMDTDEANDSARGEDQKTSKDEMWKGKTEERQITCSELFTNPLKSEEGQLLYFQLPDMLPGLPITTDEDFKKKKTAEQSDNEKESDLNKKMSGCNLDNFSEGLIGKLVVRKSGRVQLMLGSTYLDVNMGTPCGFLQDVASLRVDGDHGDISVLGHIDHRLVCTPDFEMLLDST
ncbi:DNA-directed RNA polymerase III subunit RPC4-like [Ruditapes philippinarum]|uniref:DNA-directed RNA polymerase III subunit RPC4-like n=1 Tax=Ruditapes philippinarum TaxID=129788 RepID=UPI00295C1D45|nr:DNA-directed RNA polymerase III subunit RPC4-like [Ruditapes philippinarum]